MDNKELVTLLKENDKDAFARLYHRFSGKVYNFCKLFLRSESEIEEIVQEVFIKLWDTRNQLNENDNFEGYLFIITRNQIFNKQRRSFNEDFYKVSVLNAVEEASFDMEEEIEANNLKEHIHSLINNLPKRQKEVFYLSREKHLSYKEIAKELGISEKTVERHINEALKYLKKNILLFFLFLSILICN